MANIQTYLGLTNEILGELNEVPLTTVNFETAKGIQKFVKDAINRAYYDIANENPEFPFLATTCSGVFDQDYGNTFVETDEGTRWYYLKTSSTGPHGTSKDFAKVDWDNFYLTTEGVGVCQAGPSDSTVIEGVCDNSTYTTAETCQANSGSWTPATTADTCPAYWNSTTVAPHTRKTLDFIPLATWQKHYREADDSAKDSGKYGVPSKVIMSPCGRKFGLSPMPDKEYRIYFYAWEQIEELINPEDTIKYPEQWSSVLTARARYYVWQFKENVQLAALAMEEYKKGLRLMQLHVGKPQPSTMTDDRIRYV